MNLSNSQKKIVSNVAWSLGGKAVNMASALFVGILVARYLGPESYGLMNYIGIPCAVNGILHGTFHTGITLLILVTKNLGNVCGRSINCYHNGIGQIFVTNNLWTDTNV